MTADNIVKNEEEKEPINAAGETVCSVFFFSNSCPDLGNDL